MSNIIIFAHEKDPRPVQMITSVEAKTHPPFVIALVKILVAALGFDPFGILPPKPEETPSPEELEAMRIRSDRLEQMIYDQFWLDDEPIFTLYDETETPLPLHLYPTERKRRGCGCLFPEWQTIYRRREGIWFHKQLCSKCHRYRIRMWERRDWHLLDLDL